jgi:hypothetical protein
VSRRKNLRWDLTAYDRGGWVRGRTACEWSSVTWNLGTTSVFVLGLRKTTAILDRFGQSQDLPDANWLLASSPAFKWAAPNVSTCLYCGFILKTFTGLS